MDGSPPSSRAPAPPEGYRLVWSDEFTVDGRPDPKKWNFEKGFKRNRELQWYTARNAYCKGGKLVIEARRETDMKNPNFKGPKAQNWKQMRAKISYTSASMTTRGLASWKYGRFEIKAKVQSKPGLWPAIWFLGIKGEWPSKGEIDLMECYQGKILANVAWGTRQRFKAKWKSTKHPLSPGWDEQYHVWRMDWDEESIRLYVDDKELNHIDLSQTRNPTLKFNGPPNPFHQPQYLLINLAIGGNCGGDPTHTPFPSRYLIDYVRVYQRIPGIPGSPGGTPVISRGSPEGQESKTKEKNRDRHPDIKGSHNTPCTSGSPNSTSVEKKMKETAAVGAPPLPSPSAQPKGYM